MKGDLAPLENKNTICVIYLMHCLIILHIMEDTVVILSCVRNCEKYLPESIANMQNIGKLFKSYSIVFYENDSTDKTLHILQQYANKPGSCIKIISTSLKSHPDNVYRTWRLAIARQALLNHVAEMPTENRPTYVIVMDADDVATHNNTAGVKFIESALSKKQHWDGCFPALTYDKWAYRTVNHMSNFWELRTLARFNIIPFNKNQEYEHKLDIASKIFNNNNLQPVKSAFNGIGIYKTSVYVTGTYSGRNQVHNILNLDQRKRLLSCMIRHFQHNMNAKATIYSRFEEECEHVPFHISLGEKAKLHCCSEVNYPGENF